MSKFAIQLFQTGPTIADQVTLGVFQVSRKEQAMEVMVEAPDEESAKHLVTLLTAGRNPSAFETFQA